MALLHAVKDSSRSLLTWVLRLDSKNILEVAEFYRIALDQDFTKGWEKIFPGENEVQQRYKEFVERYPEKFKEVHSAVIFAQGFLNHLYERGNHGATVAMWHEFNKLYSESHKDPISLPPLGDGFNENIIPLGNPDNQSNLRVWRIGSSRQIFDELLDLVKILPQKPNTFRNCDECHLPYIVSKSQKGRPKFCSVACSDRNRQAHLYETHNPFPKRTRRRKLTSRS